MEFFNAVAKIFLPTKSWKKHPQKLLRIPQIHFFSLTALTARTVQTEEFMFQNVAYGPTVYRTGDKSEPIFGWLMIYNFFLFLFENVSYLLS